MQAFSECKNYYDYLKIIVNDMNDNVSCREENQKGIIYLLKEKDPETQRKIIKLFKRFDKELSYNGSKNDEMFKKINYLLSIGIWKKEYKEYFDQLDEEDLFTLIYGEYSSINQENKDFIPLFANQELLKTIENDYRKKKEENNIRHLFDECDYFFMIKEHYKEHPFDLEKKEELDAFRKKMISKIKNDQLHNGVMNMLEFWNSEELASLKRRIEEEVKKQKK